MKAGCTQVFVEIAGGNTLDRPMFKRMQATLRAGDTLKISSLSRLARDMEQTGIAFQWLKENGVHLEVLDARPAKAGEPLRDVVLMRMEASEF